MGWHGVTNATPGQEDTRFLPTLTNFSAIENMRISVTDLDEAKVKQQFRFCDWRKEIV